MAQARLPIVGGTAESGWPAVGSLVATIPDQGIHPFCSGTLVAPQWVLTAAHCAQSTHDFPLDSFLLQFHIGSDANTPSSGTQVRIDYRVVHPDYDPEDEQVRHDIALVHLATPVTTVAPIAMQDTAFRQEWVGQDAFYVGFGVNDPINGAGGGVKRSAWIPIESVTTGVYYSQYDGQGVCFGDSGGPGLLQVGGAWRVIGVNSAVDSDACDGYGIHTRVDWYYPWVAATMGSELPDCNETPDMCACPEACGADGMCDNTLCAHDCAEAYDCMVDCGNDEACLSNCYYGASETGRAALDALLDCLNRNCSSASSDAAYQQCAESKCGTQINNCFAMPVGDLTCAQVYDCFYGCAQNDDACVNACYGQGSDAAQGQVMGLSNCLSQYCASETTDDGYMECLSEYCLDPYYACFPPADCDLVGGDCGAGAACYPAGAGRTDCYPSDERGLGVSCDPTLADRLACDDGLICLGDGTNGVCAQFCRDDGPCGDDQACEIPVFQSLEDLGVCWDVACTDADEDGHCADVDCDDGDAAVHPEAEERCDNAIDDDCDGQTDEGCGTCTDADADGHCADVDCDDGDAAVHPEATERCGNSVDDDCDGQTDEGCEGCLDIDDDGYCADVDCDDGSATIHPGAAEVCGNGLDDDCDGQRDEGCAACTDDDRDGVCAPLDCDDNDAAIRPGIGETCGNGIDDDCNGRTDEGCDTCTDVDQDGVCDFMDCDDADPAVFPGAREVCDNGVDDDCDGQLDEGCGGGGCAAGGTAADTVVPFVLVALGMALRRRSVASGR